MFLAAPVIDCLGLMNTNSKKPVCNNSVSVLEGNTIIISCRASLALPPASYKWAQVINNTAIPINSSKIKVCYYHFSFLPLFFQIIIKIG